MPLYDEWVILLEQEMHLFDLLRSKGLHNVELVMRQVELGSAPPRRVHGLRTLCQGLQVGSIVDAEALAQIAED